MKQIKVLVVDDAVVVRRLVADVLDSDPEICVVGVAANGRIAVDRVRQLQPDVVTLDIEMPVMDGLEALRKIRETHPRLPIIMFSTLTERGAESTLNALSQGADDYVTKPSNAGQAQLAMQRIRDDLIAKIKGLCGREFPQTKRFRSDIAPLKPASTGVPAGPGPVDGVVVGVSTGGPNALAALLPQFPVDFPVPVLIVQHMPPLFTRLLAERLDAISQLRVAECVAGARLTAGSAWLARGNYHMTVKRDGALCELQQNQDPHVNSCRPSVDVMFRSAVATWGAGTLGVVLTGMGYDGLDGCALIREHGGQVLVQDEATSVVWGMPGYVAQRGVAHEVLPLERIVPRILELAEAGRQCRTATTSLASAGGAL